MIWLIFFFERLVSFSSWYEDIACGQRSTPVVCSNNHCLNGGSCSIDLLRNRSRCICPSGKLIRLLWSSYYASFCSFKGFAGDQCQYSIDECQSSPCPQNSKCLDQTNGYKCTCGKKMIIDWIRLFPFSFLSYSIRSGMDWPRLFNRYQWMSHNKTVSSSTNMYQSSGFLSLRMFRKFRRQELWHGQLSFMSSMERVSVKSRFHCSSIFVRLDSWSLSIRTVSEQCNQMSFNSRSWSHSLSLYMSIWFHRN